MPVKKTFIFLIALMQYCFLQAQYSDSKTFTLAWNDESILQISADKSIILPLVDGNFIDENNIPVSTHVFNLQNNAKLENYQIKNVKYSALSASNTKNLNIAAIPAEIKSEFQFTKVKNKSIAILKITPLVNLNGTIQKVTSFTLDYTTGSNMENAVLNRGYTKIATNQSVLSNGTWYKFSIDTTGIFKIDQTLLREIGINTAGLDPKTIRIFGNGGKMLPQLNQDFRYDDLQENAIYIEGEADGSFDNEDYILFYGQGPDHWKLNSTEYQQSRHVQNIYSDYAYYFITVDQGPGKRIDTAPVRAEPADIGINSFQEYLFHEIDEVNLFANGQQWLGEDFSFEERQNFTFDFTDLDQNEPLLIRARAVAVSSSNTQMIFSVNGSDLLNLNFSLIQNNSLKKASSDENEASFLSTGEAINIEVFYNNNGNPSSRAYLDYIEVIGSKNLIARGKQFMFQNTDATDPNVIYEYTVQNSNAINQLWDITNPLVPRRILNEMENGAFVFKTSGNQNSFVVLGNDDFLFPQAIDDNEVANQNIHGLKDIDYAIITPSYLHSEAERLAQYHEDVSGFNVAIVDLNEIYNEFGSGSPDLTAIRDFIRFLYLSASNDATKIKYVCLFGDASFDFKDRITDNNNIIPAFQSFESFNLATAYVTDDYFGMMDDQEGLLAFSDMQDVAMGRFPVTSIMEARDLVDKTLNYYATTSLGDWRNTISFVADDPDNSGEFILQQTLDRITQEIELKKPAFNIKKIYADAHQQESSAGGELYPTVNEAIDNAIETGTLFLDYFGHGGVNGWAEERILEIPQIQKWNNFNNLPLMITVTCEFARYDNPIRPTAGEYTLWNSQGGTSHLISTTREIFISVGEVFNRNLIANLLGYEGEDYTISEALMYTKHLSSNAQRFFIYSFGDPAMKMAQPQPKVRLTKMNDIDLSKRTDTLKALSKIKLEGIVVNDNDQLLTNFNGTLSATIYDKPLDKTTLDNDNLGKKMEFTAIESKIFRGRASVTAGKFSFDFIVPKDIRIAYGNAKISMYAENQINERAGAELDILVGGIDANAPLDEEGPEIRLFMNDESFVDGGNTNSSPVLYAVLEDLSGINTSITAVDHDIIAILDDNNNNPYVLNDYYETELNDFQKGKVKFPFRNLEAGLHTIKFKCWDTYNNPSESTLSFIVVNDNDLILSNVLNYPNPFINYTEFWFNHNKPNEALDVQVQIFTVSGKLIKTLNRSVQSEGLLSREISWNGLDDFGNKIGKGVYVYKLHVRSQITNSKAEKFEKLVILQ